MSDNLKKKTHNQQQEKSNLLKALRHIFVAVFLPYFRHSLDFSLLAFQTSQLKLKQYLYIENYKKEKNWALFFLQRRGAVLQVWWC